MKIGDKIPENLGVDMNGNEVKASDYAGKKLIIYFYPKDNTPGCTAEACSLADGYGALKRAGYALLGVSKDSAKSHQKFAEKYSLPFPLIADEDTTLNQPLASGARRRWLAAPTWVPCAPLSSSTSRVSSATSSRKSIPRTVLTKSLT